MTNNLRQQNPQLWYHGVRHMLGGTIVAVVNPQGHQVRLVHHHVKHSPAGFEWGFSGSAPADLARCLLLDALDGPQCPTCTDTGKIVLDDITSRPFDPQADDPDIDAVIPCRDCDSGAPVALPYHLFEKQFVARWDRDEWRIPRRQVREWLATHHLHNTESIRR